MCIKLLINYVQGIATAFLFEMTVVLFISSIFQERVELHASILSVILEFYCNL